MTPKNAVLSCPCCDFTVPITEASSNLEASDGGNAEKQPASQSLMTDKTAWFSCPNSRESEHHILQKRLLTPVKLNPSTNPYEMYKEFFFSFHHACSLGLNYSEIIDSIQDQLIRMYGKGFEFTPLHEHPDLALSCHYSGKLWIKDETGQLTGSHKARHLMGTLIYLEMVHKSSQAVLAIYSCGNAALAASAIAKAGGWPLNVFLPMDVSPLIEEAISENGAVAVKCPRIAGETGDPSYHAFKKAISKGQLPFSCSGPDNWSNIEGGQTLMLETFSQMNGELPDHIFIQVGGGALASSAIQTVNELLYSSFIHKLPRMFVVQTESCYPLARTYFLLLKKLSEKLNMDIKLKEMSNRAILHYCQTEIVEIHSIAEKIKAAFNSEKIQELLLNSLKSEAKVATVWEHTPHSVAHGILDDFTYDWYAIICGLFRTGGWPLIVSEESLINANHMAKKSTRLPVDMTGSSGLAGFLQIKAQLAPSSSSLVFFTGIERHE